MPGVRGTPPLRGCPAASGTRNIPSQTRRRWKFVSLHLAASNLMVLLSAGL